MNNRCFAPCTGRGLMSPDITCRTGYACADVIDLNTTNNNSICVGLCTSDAECAGTNGSFGCNAWSKYCEARDRGKTKYGGPCVTSSDCESGACYTGSGWPGGYCVGNCRGDLNNCGPNGYCQYDYASFGDNVGVCGQACTTLGNLCRAANGKYGPTEYRCYQDGTGMQMGKYCDCKGTGAACGGNTECCTGSCGNIFIPGTCDP